MVNFFYHDQNTPLENFQKLIRGELPELEVTLMREPNKRKIDSRSGLQTKKSKTDLAAIDENQEKLKNCKQMFLDSIPKKEGQCNFRETHWHMSTVPNL